LIRSGGGRIGKSHMLLPNAIGPRVSPEISTPSIRCGGLETGDFDAWYEEVKNYYPEKRLPVFGQALAGVIFRDLHKRETVSQM
jgi:hypothetical protein